MTGSSNAIKKLNALKIFGWLKLSDDGDLDEWNLISHSMGGIAIAHWANQYNLKIKGAIMVAPPDLENPFQELPIENFIPIPTKKLPFPSIIVASTNDYRTTKARHKHSLHSTTNLIFYDI